MEFVSVDDCGGGRSGGVFDAEGDILGDFFSECE